MEDLDATMAEIMCISTWTDSATYIKTVWPVVCSHVHFYSNAANAIAHIFFTNGRALTEPAGLYRKLSELILDTSLLDQKHAWVNFSDKKNSRRQSRVMRWNKIAFTVAASLLHCYWSCLYIGLSKFNNSTAAAAISQSTASFLHINKSLYSLPSEMFDKSIHFPQTTEWAVYISVFVDKAVENGPSDSIRRIATRLWTPETSYGCNECPR